MAYPKGGAELLVGASSPESDSIDAVQNGNDWRCHLWPSRRLYSASGTP